MTELDKTSAIHRAELQRLLDSPPEKPTGELIGELVAFGNTIGHDAGNALLAANPELRQIMFAQRPLRDAHRQGDLRCGVVGCA